MENLDKKTLRRMDACFKYLTNPDDWRDPICKNVTLREMVKRGWTRLFIKNVIRYYTATECTFTPRLLYSTGEGYLVVESVGYRNGPAGS